MLVLFADGVAIRQTVSAEDGSYVFENVAPGEYVVVVKVAGAVSETRVLTVK